MEFSRPSYTKSCQTLPTKAMKIEFLTPKLQIFCKNFKKRRELLKKVWKIGASGEAFFLRCHLPLVPTGANPHGPVSFPFL